MGKFQSSFIPGRLKLDNIIATQEVLHSLRSRKGRNTSMVVKVDLEKVYDRVDWAFLEKVLVVTRFNTT